MKKLKFLVAFMLLPMLMYITPNQFVDTSAPQIEKHQVHLDWSEVKCLARNIFYESHGEPLAGQLAVAQITINRSRDSGMTVCSVVYEKNQFSWTNKKPAKLGTPSDDVYNLAQEVLLKGYADKDLENAYFFHAKYVKPHWRNKFKFIKTIGNHKFYGKESTDRKSDRI